MTQKKRDKYRIRNWKEYNRSLVNRGSIIFWFDEDVTKKWYSIERTRKPGRPETYKEGAEMRAILIHGNGNSKPRDNWLPYLKKELEKLGIEVDAPQFPDTELARSSYWLPFLEKLKADENTIIVGHSSGAIAAMRYTEMHHILGSALIGAYYTDLGMETEKLSGYFSTPWNWEAIKKNQKWIIQFAGANDPWIPINEAHVIRDQLQTDYYESPDQGHFGGDYYKETFPELLEAIKRKIGK